MKVCFCVPVYRKPEPEFLASLEKSIPVVKAAGWEEGSAWEVGHAYISYARTLLTRRAIMWDADQIVYLDSDVSHEPGDLLKLLETPGDVVVGTYRFKVEEEAYMGRLARQEGEPLVSRADGCLPLLLAPAGFMKISRVAVEMFARAYPDLDFSRPWVGGEHHYDLFNHGVIKVGEDKVWFGEDYAFSLRWHQMGNPLWCIPDLNLGHHGVNGDGVRMHFMGNYRKWLDKTEPQKEVEAQE